MVELVAFAFFLLFMFSPILAVLWRTRKVRSPILVISKRRLLVVISVVIPFTWFFGLIPVLPISPLFVSIALLLILQPVTLKATDATGQSGTVLATLTRVQDDLAAADVHLQSLASSIQTFQREITDKESKKRSLQAEIERQLREVEAWRQLSAEQKEVFVQAARQAMRQRSFLEVAAVVAGGLILNILASLVWVLIGSPGTDEVWSFLKRLSP